MNIFKIFEIVCWAASVVLAAWLIVDLVRTNRNYSEAVLMSSREGEIEDELVIERTIDAGEGSKA